MATQRMKDEEDYVVTWLIVPFKACEGVVNIKSKRSDFCCFASLKSGQFEVKNNKSL
jgi:hypothetical protein